MAFTPRQDKRAGILGYLMDPNKYYNNNPSFIEKGTVGGNTVSLYANNMVDLESDLTGRTRGATKCACGKFLPGTVVQGTVTTSCKPECGMYGVPCGRRGCVQSKLVHLPQARLINYKQNVKTVGFTTERSSSSGSAGGWWKNLVAAWTN
jgi:hypothetical protein